MDRAGSFVKLAELFADVIGPPPQPGEPTPEETRRERMARQAADKLRAHPTLARAARIEADGDGCLVAVAVRTPAGEIATAILTVPNVDPLDLLPALDRACGGPLQ
jgi:hypothetical protein